MVQILRLDHYVTDIVNKIKSHNQERMDAGTVLDNVGGTSDLKLVMNASRTDPHLSLVSFMAGRAIKLDPFPILIKELVLLGTSGSTRREQETFFKLAAAGKIDPMVSTRFPKTEIVRATEMLEHSGYTGKTDVIPGPNPS